MAASGLFDGGRLSGIMDRQGASPGTTQLFSPSIKENNMVAKRMGVVAVILTLSMAASGFAAEDGLEKGTPQIQSAGPMTFGPNGILFLGDPKQAAIFAIDTADTSGEPANVNINVPKINEKIAQLLGTEAGQVQIQDLAVNPVSG
jgi:hypothetical protein